MTYLEIVDTAGQGVYRPWLYIPMLLTPTCSGDLRVCAHSEEYATLRDQWIREGEGFILVYSIASRRSYERIKTFQDSILRVKRGARPTFMLVGNKSDKEKDREVSRAEAQALSTYP